MHIRTAALTLIFLNLLVSCRADHDATTPASPHADYHNPDARLHLTYPTTWTRLDYGQRDTRSLVASLSPPGRSGQRQHLAFDVRSLSDDASLDSLNEASIAEARDVFPRFELISSDKTTFAGQDARRTIYTAGTEKASARFMQVLALHAGRIYAATYTARTEEGFNRSLPQAQAIIDSARFD